MNNLKLTTILSVFVTLLCLQAVPAHAAKAKKAKADTAKKADATAEASPTPAATPTATPAATPAATPVATPTPVVEATPAPAAAVAKENDYSDAYGKKNRNLGDFVVGPFLTLASIPRPISFGVESKWKDRLGLTFAYGLLPQLTFSNVKVKLNGYDFRFKVYPFGGSFFLGVGYGSQTFTGTMTSTISGIPVTGTIAQDNTFISPQIGWNWCWDSGFFMGMDLGVQLSMKRTTTFTSDASTNAVISATPEYAALQTDIQKKADLLGKTPLPILTLIKVGYFF